MLRNPDAAGIVLATLVRHAHYSRCAYEWGHDVQTCSLTDRFDRTVVAAVTGVELEPDTALPTD